MWPTLQIIFLWSLCCWWVLGDHFFLFQLCYVGHWCSYSTRSSVYFKQPPFLLLDVWKVVPLHQRSFPGQTRANTQYLCDQMKMLFHLHVNVAEYIFKYNCLHVDGGQCLISFWCKKLVLHGSTKLSAKTAKKSDLILVSDSRLSVSPFHLFLYFQYRNGQDVCLSFGTLRSRAGQ